MKILSAFCLFRSMPLFAFENFFDAKALPDGVTMAGGTPSTAVHKAFFRKHRDGDLLLEPATLARLKSVVKRLSRLQARVGNGHFCLLNFDEMRHIADSYSNIGAFPPAEIHCLERLFYTAASRYGFLGKKTFPEITDRVDKQRVEKIPGSGNYLYKGAALDLFHKISRDVGTQLILTAGVRGIVKQFYLFLSKALRHSGNLSFASRSIAPPGYSFHAAGDFDVGKAGYGVANFTDRFVETDVYARLTSLPYVKFRYPAGNSTGIVFEPWHLQVV